MPPGIKQDGMLVLLPLRIDTRWLRTVELITNFGDIASTTAARLGRLKTSDRSHRHHVSTINGLQWHLDTGFGVPSA